MLRPSHPEAQHLNHLPPPLAPQPEPCAHTATLLHTWTLLILRAASVFEMGLHRLVWLRMEVTMGWSKGAVLCFLMLRYLGFVHWIDYLSLLCWYCF